MGLGGRWKGRGKGRKAVQERGEAQGMQQGTAQGMLGPCDREGIGYGAGILIMWVHGEWQDCKVQL